MSESKMTTTDGRDVDEVRAEQQSDGNRMHSSYIILTDEERAKGFIRPVRRTYRHVGLAGPAHPLRDLTEEEKQRYSDIGYVKFEAYTKPGSSVTGRFWTQAQLDDIDGGCGGVTTMSVAIAETYAREPHFYGATMCVHCGKHLPVGPDGEFVWEGPSAQRVGT